MTTALNPFLVSLAVALLVLGAMAASSHRRHQTRASAGPHQHGGTAGPTVLPMPTLALALALLLVPFGIALAALWGPPLGMGAYLSLFVGGVIALTVSRRRR